MFLDFISFILGKILFFTGSVIGSASFPKPLSREEEQKYLKLMWAGDADAREKLISHNMRLVAHIVKKYNGTAETDDLISVGSIGLIKAVNTFKEGKGTQLATFASRCIENEILMLLRVNKKYKNDISLSDPIMTDKDKNELSLMGLLVGEGDSVLDKVEKDIEREKFVKKIKEILTEREYTVICLRYGIKSDRNYAQREVAKFLKISRSYISRIENKAIEKIKNAVKKGEFSF